ncbi:type 4a pilus biogenesis protein PilO [Desulfoluna spongiiphila]|uniref:Type IV pilus assembly protein PilO n=1 Tax=Desulfoluna spongiiphila TaxID=419481 RepID=A0A1G5I2Y5_9BACT|nr:type 4a pilus biogenesis protein PilO [Desulfoluna spongiiphila]SCY70485.1 type IV pilus assembly protein PilO [Desulfoluna spongiiphila]
MMNKSSAFQSLDPLFKRVEELDKIQRIAICAITCIVLIGSIFYFSILPKYEVIKQQKQTLQSLGTQLEVARKKAARLASLKREWKMKEAEFRKVMRALPEKKEIPSLLTSISQSGQDTGLEFLLFQPQKEVNKEFYGEIPVSLHIKGNFHNTVMFMDKVTGLNRIVNIRDIKISGYKEGKISTKCTAVTYKFIEKKEPAKKK